jgi:hypothetical protein
MTEIHAFRCDRDSREAFINHAWETQERSLLESRQRTLLPWASVLFIKRTAPSPVQDGRRDGWDRRDKSPDDCRLVFDVILTRYLCSLGLPSLPNWPTVSASQATVSAIAATVSAYGLSLQSRQTLSALWICILAGFYPSIRSALSLYLSAFPYLSKGRNSTKKINQVSFLTDICTKKKGVLGAYIYRTKKYISQNFPWEITTIFYKCFFKLL